MFDLEPAIDWENPPSQRGSVCRESDGRFHIDAPAPGKGDYARAPRSSRNDIGGFLPGRKRIPCFDRADCTANQASPTRDNLHTGAVRSGLVAMRAPLA